MSMNLVITLEECYVLPIGYKSDKDMSLVENW